MGSKNKVSLTASETLAAALEGELEQEAGLLAELEPK